YGMEEVLDGLPSTISTYLNDFVNTYPTEFLSNFAHEPWLQFGQLDDWASLVSEELKSDTKEEYDRNQQSLEERILKAAAADVSLKNVADVFVDRLRDIKHNTEE